MGLLPDRMYETGQSKRQALAKPVSRSDPGRIEPELSRILAREDWEKFVVATSLWADGAPVDGGFRIGFSTGSRGTGAIPIMLLLIAPDAVCENFVARVDPLELPVGVAPVICRFVETSSEVEAVWGRGQGWTDYGTRSLATRRITGKTGFQI